MIVIVACYLRVCWWLDFEIDEDGMMDWQDKKVGGELEIVTIFRQEPPCSVSYPNRGKFTWYIYFLPVLASLALSVV